MNGSQAQKEQHHYEKDHPKDGASAGGTAPGIAPRAWCNDVLCLLIFLAFLSGMSYISGYAYKNGNPMRLTHGFDFRGRLCGVDKNVSDKPLLYYCPSTSVGGLPTNLNLKAPVCVARCPTDSNETIQCLTQTTGSAQIVSSAINTSQTTVLSQRVEDTTSYATTEILGLYCMPDAQKLETIASVLGIPMPAGLRTSMTDGSGPIGNFHQKLAQYAGSIRRCSLALSGMFMFTVLLGYIWLILIKRCAKLLFYIALFFLTLLFLSSGVFLLVDPVIPSPAPRGGVVFPAANISGIDATTTAAPLVLAPVTVTVAPNSTVRRLMTFEEACNRLATNCTSAQKRWEAFGTRANYEAANPFYNEHMAPADARMASLITGAILVFFGFITVCVQCCCAKHINEAMAVLKAACDALWSMPCMLVMPLIETITKVILFMSMSGVLLLLISSGKVEQKTYSALQGEEVNGLRRHFTFDQMQMVYIGYYLFGMIWMMELVNAIGSFVISYSVVSWYFIPNPKTHNWCGLFWGYLYATTAHLGSLAFGSLLIAILRPFRIIIGTLCKAADAKQDGVAACLAKILLCFIECFRRFVEMVNKNAYIDVCITSNNFCSACVDVMEFLAGEGKEIMILNGACMIFTLTGTLSISTATGYAMWLAVTTQPRWTDETSPHHVASPRAVAITAGVMAAFIAYSFMQVLDHTADTLLYTYAWNKSKAHNTVSKYAPPSLIALTNHEDLVQQAAGKEGGGNGQAAPQQTSWFRGGAGSWFGGSKAQSSSNATAAETQHLLSGSQSPHSER